MAGETEVSKTNVEQRTKELAARYMEKMCEGVFISRVFVEALNTQAEYKNNNDPQAVRPAPLPRRIAKLVGDVAEELAKETITRFW